MIDDLIKYFKDKKILILGFGREGQSTYNLIRKYLKEQIIYIADRREVTRENYLALYEDDNVEIITGENYLDNLNDYDIIMKSPGIPFVGIDTTPFADKVKSQLELLLEFSKVKTIGITGTKGKSTTSSLIYKVLKDQNINTMLLGNIGTPVFDYIDSIDEDMILVLEMSSHQLEYMEKSPNISILLNIYEEHLDHYEAFEKYIDAKCNIFKYQDENDYLLYNFDNLTLKNKVKNNKAQTYKVSLINNKETDINIKEDKIYFKNEPIYDVNEERNLQGEYNLNNIMFVLGVCKILNLNMLQAIKSINEFETLAHRLEFVGKYDGVLYYDNSIATIPMATIEAVKALKNVNTLIIGGMDRGINYEEFIDFLNESDIENIICMPKTGYDIAKKLKKEKVYLAENMEDVVGIAKDVTQKETICLLSPAAASYGFFKNFEEKGNIYKELVKQ